MPLYLNNVSVAGYLSADPDGKPTQGGLPRAKFTVTLNHPAKKVPYYVKCVAWGERAEAIVRYATKGQEIIVSGELEQTTWSDRNQMKHTTTEIVVEKFNLGAKPRARIGEANLKRPSPPITAG